MTENEIKLAVEQSGVGTDTLPPESSSSTQQIVPASSAAAPPVAVSRWSQARDVASSAIVVGGISYALYALFQVSIFEFRFEI